MPLADQIEQKVKTAIAPDLLQVHNESHMHAGPATESHFKLVVVAKDFGGLSKVRRHQLMYRALADELAGPVHALALHLYTPEEWRQQQEAPASPLCAGKNK